MKQLIAITFILASTYLVATTALAANVVGNEQIKALAENVKPGEVVVYSFNGCSNCAQTKVWLHENGFKYTECNVTENESCAKVFRDDHALGAPYVVVRGHQMKHGFNQEEFIAALQ